MTTRKRLRGIELRYVLTRLVSEARVPVTIPDLRADLLMAGFAVDGRASKTISDALRWEVRRGRVEHRGRGLYGQGYIPRSTEYRIIARVQKLKHQAEMEALDEELGIRSADGQPVPRRDLWQW
ncbi:hypothetical protein [Mycolicibacterium brumae]|uniref:hypothetical protein n=1 Tax=Mycolicibacterium brumae TaxID=85968 RepID=UPI001F17C36B|nr:hypothetical protein [Mycolicibacterium brumae]UWW07300.1 hypothetical protein L2Z93_000302 [Mycolicibacterium brumae]